MQYVLLIYRNEAEVLKRTPEEKGKITGEYMQFSGEIRKSGHFKGGEPLQPVTTATTVRVRDGKVLKTDGPFAETREQLGGFYLVDAKDLDEAVGIAARIPDVRNGSVEIRPVIMMPT
jgi:hypothetical protein